MARIIRRALCQDASEIHEMIMELADFEKCIEHVELTVQNLKVQLEQKPAPFECIVCEEENIGLVGFALFFYTYSTWTGRQGLHLEDLYVRPQYRSSKVGRELLQVLVEKARADNLGRVEWMVLHWNKRAQKFYSSLGARPVDDFARWRLDQEAINQLAPQPSICSVSVYDKACVGAL